LKSKREPIVVEIPLEKLAKQWIKSVLKRKKAFACSARFLKRMGWIKDAAQVVVFLDSIRGRDFHSCSRIERNNAASLSITCLERKSLHHQRRRGRDDGNGVE